ncbi:hypothetical protein [Candidatus Clostridium stratigraminis]|uniref:Uncharacterized protein n=1 Tax=Candidatus Clostridium stratigraminis TaxID=3381661 RepID=A0ABW8T5C2_9CLOT
MNLNSKVEIFVKLNILSALYALTLFIQIQLMGNIYRIARITDWLISTVNVAVGILNLTLLIFTSFLFYLITKKYLSKVKLRFLITILWIPYYAIFTSSLSPAMVRGEEPPPVLGLLFIGIFLIYPFYIAFINLISSANR